MILLKLDDILDVIKPQYDEDMVDRLNNRLALFILFGGAITVFSHTFIGSPINCFGKADWASDHIEYATNLCFVEGSYFVPLNSSFSSDHGFSNYKKLSYYQWTPFILSFLGFLFILPRALWSFVNWSANLNLGSILREVNEENKQLVSHIFLKNISKYIIDVLQRAQNLKKMPLAKKLWTRMFGVNYLTRWYVAIKILHIFCCLISIFIVSTLIADQNQSLFGLNVIKALLYGANWRETGYFPRVSICYFYIREMGVEGDTEMVPKTAQCTLLTNMYIEKTFMVVWYGLFLLLIVNSIDLLRFIYLLNKSNRKKFLYDLIKPSLDYILSKIHQDTKWQQKFLEKKISTQNKRNNLKKVTNYGNSDQIEAANLDYLKAKKANFKQTALKKREDYNYWAEHRMKDFVNFIGADVYLIIQLIYCNAGSFSAGIFTLLAGCKTFG